MPQIFKLSIFLFLLQLSSFLVIAFVHDDLRDAEKVSHEVSPELSQVPIDSNVFQEHVPPEDIASSNQYNDHEQETTGFLPVEPAVDESNWWPFGNGGEDAKDPIYSDYEREGYSTDPRVDDVLDTENVYPTVPDESYPNIVYQPNQEYTTEHNLPEEGYFTKLPADINEMEYATEPGVYVEPEQNPMSSYNSREEENNTTTDELPEETPGYQVESVFVPIDSGIDDWSTFDIDDYQSQRKVEEELAADLKREPMRPVHRSPVHWLQREVERLGQPRHPACLMELDRGLGPDEVSSWYYDSQEMRCRWFGYRGYAGNANRFASRVACEGYCIKDTENLCEMVTCSWTGTQCTLERDYPCVESARIYRRDWQTKCPPDQPVCMSRRSTRIAPDIDVRSIPIECLQDKDAGSCQRKNPSVMFHYDRESNDCMTFYFHDCGGNDNRFETKSDCMTHCAP